ncbi:VOC family protein [Alicyclobacillus fastidiosus]|uniref:VOC family protein n=1 Tax=Alicyclobacillus fastidiosus TaxID=392011 RepID=A0ABY6ZKF9_9BACL|nr:VOC family protein [Alicyclobacillus fastidiosus]WAH43423.1 VOC family protein [Alicyclobacillus fastidiosus]GMA59572.1 VOC family protein [Alicyclobacillus fastidiosus]GMA65499.1 VOC family protein [Alicyclobacillus fastidiosus]
MAKLTPYFYSEDARAQAQFYVQALGGEIHNQMTYGQAPGTDEALKDKIIHMAFSAAGVNFYIADTMHESPASNSGFDLSLEFKTDEETQQAFSKLSEGGRVIMPLEKQFWGSLFGRLEDKFGVKWQVTTEAQG